MMVVIVQLVNAAQTVFMVEKKYDTTEAHTFIARCANGVCVCVGGWLVSANAACMLMMLITYVSAGSSVFRAHITVPQLKDATIIIERMVWQNRTRWCLANIFKIHEDHRNKKPNRCENITHKKKVNDAKWEVRDREIILCVTAHSI